jgi:nitrate reductase assembly molybdenum cofactor insertion protein NarJ
MGLGFKIRSRGIPTHLPIPLEFNHSIGFEEDYMLFENHDFIKNKSFSAAANGTTQEALF